MSSMLRNRSQRTQEPSLPSLDQKPTLSLKMKTDLIMDLLEEVEEESLGFLVMTKKKKSQHLLCGHQQKIKTILAKRKKSKVFHGYLKITIWTKKRDPGKTSPLTKALASIPKKTKATQLKMRMSNTTISLANLTRIEI